MTVQCSSYGCTVVYLHWSSRLFLLVATLNNAERNVCVNALCKAVAEFRARGLYLKNIFLPIWNCFRKIAFQISSLNFTSFLKVHTLAPGSGLDFQEMAPLCQVEV